MMNLWLLPLAMGCSLVLTGLIRRYALARRIIDMPNERSSHRIPTPRGGGVAIVVVFLCSVALLWRDGLLATGPFLAIAGSGLAIALVGFLDDHGHVAARWRLLVHFAGAAWALAWLGGMPPLPMWGIEADLGKTGWVIAAFGLVWLLNLYNFMDGIDGIAGIEAVTVCAGGALLWWLLRPDGVEWFLALSLAAAVAGFLFWNFPAARIFMGDAGSGFLGIVLGVLAVQAAWHEPRLLWSWLILLGVFVVDATVTLLRRVKRGEKFYEAHRSHAYQYAARTLGGHVKVSLAVAGINLAWLLPVALLVGLGHLDGWIALVVAYLPLVALAYRFKAGARESQTG